jgi:hypothetical protein
MYIHTARSISANVFVDGMCPTALGEHMIFLSVSLGAIDYSVRTKSSPSSRLKSK